jgi:hypothetical protein
MMALVAGCVLLQPWAGMIIDTQWIANLLLLGIGLGGLAAFLAGGSVKKGYQRG